MKQRGRQSTEAQLFTLISGKLKEPPPAPANMPQFAQDLWQRITRELGAEYFRESDLPLLQSYCWAAWQADAAQRMLADDGIHADKQFFELHRQAVADMAKLAVKLRLCPSTRERADSAKLKQPQGAVRKPWEA